MPAFARFSTAAARGYKPLGAAPYALNIVESAASENGTVNITWKNNIQNRTIYLQYSVNYGSWINIGQIGNSTSTTAYTTVFGPNVVNLRVRMQYMTATGNFSNIYTISNAITTRPAPPAFYDPNFTYALNIVRGYMANNGYMQVGVYPSSPANTTTTITRNGTTIATNVTSPNTYSFTANATLVTWGARSYNSATGLYSTLVTQNTYVDGYYNASWSFGINSGSGTGRNFSIYYNGALSTYVYNGGIQFFMNYTADRYCDSTGNTVLVSNTQQVVGPYYAYYNAGTTLYGFVYDQTNAAYGANETYNVYMLDLFGNYIQPAGGTSFYYYVGYSDYPC